MCTFAETRGAQAFVIRDLVKHCCISVELPEDLMLEFQALEDPGRSWVFSKEDTELNLGPLLVVKDSFPSTVLLTK